MNNDVFPKVKVIMNQANVIAKGFDDVEIKAEHVLLSILQDEDNACTEVFTRLNVNREDLHDKISQFLRDNDLTPRLTIKKGKLPFSKDMQTIIKSVLDNECEKLNNTIIDTTHIVLSILISTNLEVTKYLTKETGVTYKKFLNMMDMENKEIKNSAYSNDDDDQEDINKSLRAKKTVDTKSKTPVLDNFCRDVSKAVEKGEIDPVVGRKTEIKRVSQILSRRKKNNPVLIGEPGVGKTSIVEGLAQLIKDGEAPRTLTGKKIFTLELASIVAGTKYRGQFEERMKAILEECKANPDIILFIDELHTIIGAGNASGSLDASNIVKPALARGEIQIIGATTLDEYRENIEKDGALTRRFQQVLIEEPTLEETKTILMNIKEKYEKHHKVIYTEEAIDECVKLSARYIMDRAMPDKAIDIMDEAGASTNVSLEKPENIKILEAKKAKVSQEKTEVANKQNYEEAAKLRDYEKEIKAELAEANEAWQKTIDENVTEVDVELISEIVSMVTGIPLTKISTQESKRLINMDKDLQGKVIGQDAAVTKVVKAIKRNRIGIKDKNKPVGSFIFLGPTGVGKTHLAKLLAEEIFGDADALIRMDMSEYMEKHSVSRLVGPPPGYVGYDQGGQLTEKVRRKPHCVILFDEIEKAHTDVFNILLQLLDEGMLTDGLGRKVNFKNSLIILTSNIGVKEVQSFGKPMGLQTGTEILTEETKVRNIIDKALKKNFKPEFLNRIDEAIIFNSLSKEDISKIIFLELASLEKRIDELHFKFEITQNAVDYLVKVGYDEAYGARPLARAIQKYVEDPVADEILLGNVKDGETLVIDFDSKIEQIVVTVKKIETLA
jgi:ATP-dependent Clp protease ATP-binding subunit ClpC